MSDMKFILWTSDESSGDHPQYDDRNAITSDGAIGRVCADNVYLTTYGAKPDGAKAYADLEVNECVRGVEYRLSGSKGKYDIYRVS